MKSVDDSRRTLKCGRVIASKKDAGRLPVVLHWRESLDKHLSKKGLNQSESRNKIAETILQQKEHFTVQDLIRKVQAEYPSIGEATVYRNMAVFVDIGLIKESLSRGHGQSVFEVASAGHHDHIVCLDCDAIIEFQEPKIETLQDKVSKILHFKQAFHNHVIYAHCGYLKHKS